MAKESIDVLIEGGKATAAPPLGPALGPMGVNIGQVVADINAKTKEFAGMKVPVKVIIDKDTKEFTIKVGTPPASALIKKEAGVKKGAANAKTDKVADLKVEQIIKIAKMKQDSLLGKDNFSKVMEIVGTCNSMGILVEGKPAKEFDAQQFKDEILSGKTELSAAEMKELADEKKKLQEEMEARREEFEDEAKKIIAQMEGKSRSEMIAALNAAEIPAPVFEPMLPEEKKEEAKPAESEKKD